MPPDQRMGTLPPERFASFLWVRQGLPLMGIGLSLLAALFNPHWRGWLVLGAAACFGVLWPTFKRGQSYLRARTSIVRFDALVTRLFRPVARWIGKEDAWILSFCGWNNHLVRGCFEAGKSRNAILLLPHCIQLARCKADILADLQSCYECGLCPAEDVLRGMLDRRWKVSITNRSFKAYREARAFRPDLVVAVSCTDRLLKGLTRLAEVPAYVLPLGLPHGMCVDTTFDSGSLVAAMDLLVEPRPAIEMLTKERSGVA